ncbi:MAG: hypothetical protein QG574_3872 [Cyanobacteriota bacterium erpe_2018_sw_21hr_WHONDRS-SW48-000092_B_bin.40]|jgi:hypothetical protein|nr:hypothetical protein [Cyanobacteriota bacterium erpe_2018_sw_21hr_WHONDRS-SW48-000092_B_bin.40]
MERARVMASKFGRPGPGRRAVLCRRRVAL